MMPIENDIFSFSGKKLLKEDKRGNIYAMEHYLRKALIFESAHLEWLVNEFETVFSCLEQLQPDEEEPMMNIVALYENDLWQLILFPRKQHRPSQFFEEGEKQILFSPGAVDFGGMLIFPKEADFEKMNGKIIENMFLQLTFTDEMWKQLVVSCQLKFDVSSLRGQ
jgi:hypothetical protein